MNWAKWLAMLAIVAFSGAAMGATASLELGASERGFTADAASSKELKVTANVSWTAKSSASWLAVKTASGTGNGKIVYNVAANSGTASRTAKITVAGGGLSRTFAVTQDGKPGGGGTTASLSLKSSSRSFTADAASGKEMSVMANVPWTAKSSASWLVLKTAKGSGNGKVAYNVAANTGTASRSATITVSGGGLARTFTVVQSGNTSGGGTAAALALGASERSFTAAAAGGKELKVTANVSWTTKSSASWLELKTASGTGNGTIVYGVSANPGTGNRTGKITVSGGGLAREFTVKQQASGTVLALGTDSRTFTAAAAGGKELKVTANVAWTAKSSASWLSLKTAGGTGNGKIAYGVSANAGTAARTGKITVTGGGLTRTCTVVQAGGTGTWELTPGKKMVFTVPLDEQGIEELKDNGGVTEARIGLWVPEDFNPAQEWGILIISTTWGGGLWSAVAEMNSYQVATQEAGGWILMGADGATDPNMDSFEYRWTVARAGLKALEARWPAARKWPVVAGGFSGGAKVSQLIGGHLMANGYKLVGMWLGGCNEGTYASQAIRNYAPGEDFLDVPIFLSSGDNDSYVTPEWRQEVLSTLQEAGFTNIRQKIYGGDHHLYRPHLTEGLQWFKSWRPPAKLAPEAAARTFTAAAANSQKLGVKANVPWTAKSSVTWLKVKQGNGDGNGTITYDVAANAGTASRTGKITLSGNGLSRTVTVLQLAEGMVASLALGAESRSFTADGGAGKELSVKGNVAWMVESAPGWVTVKTDSGAGNGTIVYDVAANPWWWQRGGYVKVTGGGLTQTFTVWQSGKVETLELGASSRTFTAAAANDKTLKVTANVSWTVRSSVSWLTVKTAKGSGDGTIVYDVAANTGSAQRTGVISVKGGGYDETPRKFTVIQNGTGAKTKAVGGKGPGRVWVTTSDGSDGGSVADGDESTGWSPSGADGGWVALTFGEARDVRAVEVVGEGLPEGMRVLVSEDGDTWSEEGGEAVSYLWVLLPDEGEVPVVREIVTEP